jgi:hypothetical protein
LLSAARCPAPFGPSSLSGIMLQNVTRGTGPSMIVGSSDSALAEASGLRYPVIVVVMRRRQALWATQAENERDFVRLAKDYLFLDRAVQLVVTSMIGDDPRMP